MLTNTTSAEFFEAKYKSSNDPWHFRTSPYEHGRYEQTIKALSDRTYNRAFEPGCSIGTLTSRLAKLCTEVLAIEISATAVKLARERCRPYPNVRIVQAALSEAVPSGPFDLIVLSEIGYYFRASELDLILWSLCHELTPEGVLLAVHWLGQSSDHRLSGDEVHEQIHLLPGLNHTLEQRYEQNDKERYRLDRWERI